MCTVGCLPHDCGPRVRRRPASDLQAHAYRCRPALSIRGILASTIGRIASWEARDYRREVVCRQTMGVPGAEGIDALSKEDEGFDGVGSRAKDWVCHCRHRATRIERQIRAVGRQRTSADAEETVAAGASGSMVRRSGPGPGGNPLSRCHNWQWPAHWIMSPSQARARSRWLGERLRTAPGINPRLAVHPRVSRAPPRGGECASCSRLPPRGNLSRVSARAQPEPVG